MRRCIKHGLYGAGIGLALWILAYFANQPPLETFLISIPVLDQLIDFLGSPICTIFCGYFPGTQCQETCFIAFGAFLNMLLGLIIGALYGEMDCNHD